MRLIPQPYSVDIYPTFSLKKEITKKTISDEFDTEEYELLITPDSIEATAKDEKGFFYAETTLKQLRCLYTKIPCMKICDKPRFTHRGFMIDCARHMISISELKRMIEAAAFVKLNKFHWHLSDDQGFRIELDSFPEITQKGSVRKCDTFRNCESDKEYGGYYTKEEIREIISFCAERHIDVIPELDMPGHLSALLHVHPEFTCSGKNVEVKTKQGIFSDILCVGNETAVNCIKTILREIGELFPYPVIHIGGDEVPKKNWKTCDKCREIMLKNNLHNENELQCHFMNEMADFLGNMGKKCIVWNDFLKGGNASDSFVIQHWMHSPEATAKAVNNGQKLILSPFTPYYADYPYAMHPMKAVYEFEPDSFRGLSDKGRKNIIGVESPIWTEFVLTDERLEYMCFPRFFAVAEASWTSKENKNYKDFESVCRKLTYVFNNNGFHAAEEKEWNPTPLSRLKNTLSFFI